MGQAGKGGGARYETVELIVSPAKFDGEVLALDIAAFLQTLPDGGHDGSIRSRRRGTEKSHHRHRRLLRARREGQRRRRAAEQRDEFLARPLFDF